MGWLKKRISPAVMFDRMDHCAKKAIPMMVNTDEMKSISFCFSIPQIAVNAMITTKKTNRFRILIVILRR